MAVPKRKTSPSRRGMRRSHDAMGNHQDLIDAITQKLWPLGNDVTFIPGHGPTSTFGRERQTNAFVSDYALS